MGSYAEQVKRYNDYVRAQSGGLKPKEPEPAPAEKRDWLADALSGKRTDDPR
jgi:hypothetical protein